MNDNSISVQNKYLIGSLCLFCTSIGLLIYSYLLPFQYQLPIEPTFSSSVLESYSFVGEFASITLSEDANEVEVNFISYTPPNDFNNFTPTPTGKDINLTFNLQNVAYLNENGNTFLEQQAGNRINQLIQKDEIYNKLIYIEILRELNSNKQWYLHNITISSDL